MGAELFARQVTPGIAGAITIASALVTAILPAQDSVSVPERVAHWREDLAFFADRLPKMHPNPYFGCTSEEFAAAVHRLHQRIPDLSDARVIVEFMRLMGLLSRKGREGHAGVWSHGQFEFLPVRLYEFKDGLFVVKAAPAYKDLVGAEVVGIGSKSTQAALAAIAPVLTFDNEWSARVKRDFVILMPEVLVALGVADSTAKIELRVRKGTAEPRAVSLEPQGAAAYRSWGDFPPTGFPKRGDPLYLSRTGDAFWSKFLVADKTLYCQFNSVRRRDARGQTLAAFVKKLRAELADRSPVRFIVDVRLNGGGDNTVYRPFLDLLKEMRFTPGCRLFLLTSRHTFSAAGNFVTEVERFTNAVLVGEPSGGAPNQYGDSRLVKLPNHPNLRVYVATRYHEKAEPGDDRLVHAPDLRVELSFADWFAGRDPVLELVLRQK